MSTLICLLVVAALALALAGCSRREGRASTDSALTPPTSRRSEQMGAASSPGDRTDIERRLEKLARSRAREVKSGVYATCYVPAMPPERFEYVCPACGAKTLYARGEEWDRAADLIRTLQWELDACRRGVKELKGIRAELYEKEFCSRCTPGAVNPRLGLIVRYEGASEPHIARGISSYDLTILKAFLNGEETLKSSDGDVTPLKKSLPRLRELLGLPADQEAGTDGAR